MVDGIATTGAERTVSVRGRFDGSGTILVKEVHFHVRGWRDFMSYVGLLLVTGWWGLTALRR